MGKVARKLRKYFQKRDAIDPGGGLPDQQVNAERAHYWVPNSYNHGPPRLWSPPPAPDRIIVSRLDTRPETPVRTPMTVQNANRGAPVRRIGPLESMNSSASQSEQRREVSGTSTWEMSSIEAGNIGETSDPSKPKRPLTTIQEGQPYQSSSSRNAGTNTRPIGYGIFRDPMNIEHSGGRPFDAMQLARNLRLRREKSKYESLGSNETATDSRENLITRDQQGEVAYTNEQELYSRYLSRRSQEFRSPSNTAPGSHGVRQYQSLQHLSQGYNNHAESSHSFLPSTARDQSRFAADEIYSRNQAPYDQSQSIGPAPTLRDPGDEFSEDSGSIYSREPDGTRYFISENARSHGRAQPIRPMPRSPLLPPSPTFHAGNSSELGASDQSSPEMVSIDAVRLNSARPARESIVSPQTINGVRLATTIDSARIAARESSCKSPTTSTSAEAGQTPPSSVRLAKTPTTSGNLTRYKRQIGHRRGYRQLYNHNEQLVCRLRDEFPSLEQYHYPDPAKLDLSPDPPDYEQPQQAEPHAVSGSHEIECQLPALDSAPRSTSPLDHERPHGVELYEGYGTHERSEFEAEDSRSAPQSISPLGHEQPHGVGLYEGYSTYKRSEFENEDSRSAHTSTNLPSHEQELQMRSPSELNIPRSTPVPPEAKALKMSMPKFPVYGSGWDLDSENQRPSGGFKETRKTKTARLPSERQYGRSNNKNQPHLASQASQYAAATNFRVPPSNEYASNDMGYENQRQRGQYHNRPHGSSYTSDSDSPLARHSNRAKKMAASRKRMAVGGTFHAYVEDSPEDDSPALI
ncbi:hypothetical protein MMC10_007148 [Thelotrema lepadinum]|nr:hypothetical protein [Thelotrema lepadinum]